MHRGDLWALLGAHVVCLQVDLYLAPVNTVARRVPTVLSVVSSVAFFWRCGALAPSDALAPLYAYFVVAVFSLNLNQFVSLFQSLQPSIDEFNALYAFPDAFAHAVVYLGAAVMLLTPVAMLGAGGRARVLGAFTLWSFNVVDGAIFESNTELDECYKPVAKVRESTFGRRVRSFLFVVSRMLSIATESCKAAMSCSSAAARIRDANARCSSRALGGVLDARLILRVPRAAPSSLSRRNFFLADANVPAERMAAARVLSLAAVAYVAVPPRIAALGGENKWSFVSLDLETGARYVVEFKKTYVHRMADFDTNVVMPGPTRQGFLGFARSGHVRLVMHYTEQAPGVATVTAICTRCDDFEVARPFFAALRRRDDIVFETECMVRQPRWLLLRAHYAT